MTPRELVEKWRTEAEESFKCANDALVVDAVIRHQDFVSKGASLRDCAAELEAALNEGTQNDEHTTKTA